jgi:hypothetical protein
MSGKRSSARIAANTSSSPAREDKKSPQTGKKRKAGTPASSPKGKRGKKTQITIEESMPQVDNDETTVAPENTEMEDTEGKKEAKKSAALVEQHTTNGGTSEKNQQKEISPKESTSNVDKAKAESTNGHTSEKSVPVLDNKIANETNGSAGDTRAKKENTDGGTIELSANRKKNAPSNIIEKGIIYFFTRGRVGVEDVESIQDLQRTYFVLRPLPIGAKLGDGAIEDSKENRLFALPKKYFPKSRSDRFMAFVEKSKVTMKELKEDVFKSSENETKTMGTRVTPSISPIGEGVYAVTETGNNSHLVYMLTIPDKPKQVQEELGLHEKGSFIISLKNPTVKGPANASLPQKPDFPQEIIDDFRGLSWLPVHKSSYLDYTNAQILLIGEGQDMFGSAVEPAPEDKKGDKDTPQEVLEKLEDEDQLRIEHLHGK